MGISRVRWMFMTSGRNLPRLESAEAVTREFELRRSCASGWAESDSSMSMSSSDRDELDEAEDLRRRFEGGSEVDAQSGTGFRRSNCRLRRFTYSGPVTISSASLTRNFRSRGFPAREIVNLSSSLSCQAGSSPSDCSSSDPGRAIKSLSLTSEGPASIKKSWDIC